MYSVKKVKTFRGMEGEGYNADLYRDGKKIAFVIDEGCGGETRFEWLDLGVPKVDIIHHGYGTEPITYKGTPEEKLFVELADSQTYTFDGHTGRKNADILVGELITIFLTKRDCKNKTVFRLASDGEGIERTIKAKFTPEIATHIRTKYGADLVEIVNERPEIRE